LYKDLLYLRLEKKELECLNRKTMTRKEQIMRIFKDYSVTHGGLTELADAILALQSEQIDKYKELIEVMDKLYEVSCDVFYDLEIDPTDEMGKLYIKIQLLKTELGL